MKKTNFLLIGVLCIFLVQSAWADTTAKNFKFPKKIQFKVFKNDRSMGQCFYRYEHDQKQALNRSLFSLTLDNFGGMGFTSQLRMHTYIFRDDLSAYLVTIMRGKTPLEQFRLKKGLGFDGKQGQVFIHKDMTKGSGDLQTELFTEYPVISFLSTFFIASHRVASGSHKANAFFNLLIDRSTKIVEMRYGGPEKTPFAGSHVTAETILLTNPNNNDAEVFRMRIYKDSDGYCFPVSILYNTRDKNNREISYEIRADRIAK